MRIHQFAGSSSIDHLTFDEATGTLSVMFHDSGKYVYFDVAEAVYDAFCAAVSPGAFLNSDIKNRYEFSLDPARRRFGPKAKT